MLPTWPAGSLEGEARLAARVLQLAVEDARAGDRQARAFVTSPRRLAFWAGALSVEPERLAELARALGGYRRRADRHPLIAGRG